MIRMMAIVEIHDDDRPKDETRERRRIRWSADNRRQSAILMREGDRFAARHDAPHWHAVVIRSGPSTLV